MRTYFNLETSRPFASRGAMAILAALVLLFGARGALYAAEGSEARLSYSVAIDGDRAVVGTQWEDGFKGAAYALRKDGGTWAVEGRLLPAELGWYDHFGGSVAIRGDYVVVGASWHDLFRGAAYVFKRDGDKWVHLQTLTASDAAVEACFGRAVSFDGRAVLVGSGAGSETARSDVLADEAGATYRFTLRGDRWIETEKTAVPSTSVETSAADALPEDPAWSAVLHALSRSVGEDQAPPLMAAEPPAPPDSVKATGGVLAPLEAEVKITWWPHVKQDAIVYMVRRDGDLLSVVSSDETQYSDTSAEFDSTYQYCVRVKDMTGAQSTDVCDDGGRIIRAPGSMSASDGEYVDKVLITWMDMSSVNTGYSIRRSHSEIGTAGPNASIFDDTTADPDSMYFYEVVATVTGGYESEAKGDSGWVGVIKPPKNVSASDGQYADRVRITWQGQAPDTMGYRIYKDDWPIMTIEGNVCEYEDFAVENGETYTYCVAATTQEALTGVDPMAGAPPARSVAMGPGDDESARVCDKGGVGFTAPGEVSASDSTYDDRVRVTWKDLCKFEDGYEISRVASPDTTVLDTTRANITLYDDLTAEPDTPYTYLVRAVHDLGGVSPYGADGGYRSVVVAPTDVQASDGAFEDHVDITWKSTSTTAVLFKIYRNGVLIKSVSKGDRLYRDSGGTAGQVYSYTVAAVTALEVEAASDPDSGKRELRKPTGLSASDEAYEDRVVVSWKDTSALEQGYVVCRQDTHAVEVDTSYVGANRTSYADYSAVPGVTYNYLVRAYDDRGEGRGYSPAAADYGLRVLLAPTDVRADKGVSETEVEITWVDNSNAEDGYRVYRDAALLDSTGDNHTSYVDALPDSLLGRTSSYDVVAFDDYGESEAASDSGYATILAPVSFNASDFYEDRIELTWVDRSEIEEGFRVYRDGEWLASLGPDTTSYADRWGLELAGGVDTPGTAVRVAVSGDYAYVADYSAGLQVIDISDPENPSIVGSVGTPDFAIDVAVAGDYAYVADYGAGLQVIGISDPENPSIVGSVDTPGTARGVAVAGDYAYVGDEGGLQVIDISDPENPAIVGSVATPDFAIGGAVAGNYAYVADYGNGLQVIDISDPENPAIVGNVDTPGTAGRVAVSGGHAYVADYGNGLQVIDISDPENPSIAGSVATPGTALDVAVSGGHAYVADYDGGLQVIDISDPGNPSIAVSVDTPGNPYGVALAGKYAYVADHTSGLQVISETIVPGQTYEYYVQAYNGTLAGNSNADHGSVYVPEPAEVEVTEVAIELLASDGAAGDWFGVSVAISGDRAIVGASTDDDNGDDSGSAYIFERDADGRWEEAQKLLAGDGATYDIFGHSVDISGEVAIVAAQYDDDNGNASGSAYIFERGAGGAWTQTQKLLASDGAADDEFGVSVAISGDKAIVGAQMDDYNGYASGSAYIFERNADGTWGEPGPETGKRNETVKLLASDGAAWQDFGCSVGISDDRVIVGAVGDDANGNMSGSAYIFERDAGGGWEEAQKLLASDGAADDYFGVNVAISGEVAIVGAWGDDDNGDWSGSAYIFERDAGGGWEEAQKLLASDGAADDRFGYDEIGISGDRAIVGAYQDDDNGDDSGSAYIFERDAGGRWEEAQKLLASDGAADDHFGFSVGIGGGAAIVGAVGDDANGDMAGSAYVCDVAGSAYGVTATDGALNSRVRITWQDRSTNERGFRIYRDGGPIASVEPNVEVYEDFDAEPGRTYQYGVATLKSDLSEELPEVLDCGWRPANGNITGRIATRGGAAAEGVSVAVEPLPTKALLLDGTGGHVVATDSDGTFGFTKEDNYTLETWAKYAGDGGYGAGDGTMIAKAFPQGGASQCPFSISNMRGSGDPGRICVKMSDGTNTVRVSSDSTGYNDNRWHHIACVHDAAQDEMRLYVDGVLQGDTTYASLGNIKNKEPLSLGAGADSASWFGGQLDEVRIWKVIRSATDINGGMHKPLVGNEPGLVAYWPFDEGSPTEERQGGNAAITDLTSGAHYGYFVDGVYWTESSASLDIYPVTDAEGNFVLRGIRYGTLAEFKVRPFDAEREGRQFEPAYRLVTLTTQDPVENQVDFGDISSFTVSGVVRYEGTDCPAADVSILVDDQSSSVTDKNGKFAVSVDYMGDDPHTIEPLLEGHTFEPKSYTLAVDRDTLLADSNGVTFTDMTKRTLSGRVGGGCGRSIGDIVITIQSETGCMVESITVSDSSYSASLPPQAYLVTAAVVEDSVPSGLDRTDVVGYFQNLGERRVDLSDTTATLDFVYRAPLQVTIAGLDSYVTCDELTFEGRPLPADLPVIPQGTSLELSIVVKEDYGESGTCPLDSGTVTIYDEISDREDEPAVLEVRDGVAGVVDSTGQFIPHYRTVAITPSLIVGRTDDSGNDRSFQKYLRAVATVEGRSPVMASEWALVTGHVAPEGADFVTFVTDPMPLYVLRDPPGDNSYAFLDKGYAFSTMLDCDVSSLAHTDGGGKKNYIKNVWWGVDWSLESMYKWLALQVPLVIQGGYNSQATYMLGVDSLQTTVVTTRMDKRFATSSRDSWAGESGDVFIGAGLNYIFAKVGVVQVEDCQVVLSDAVGLEPEGFSTAFAYTQRHIAEMLIPELNSMADYYTAKADLDSAAVFRETAETWQNMLAENEYLKSSSRLKENRSFSAGTDYEYSFASDTTRSFRTTTTLFLDTEKESGGAGSILNLLGVRESEKLSVDITRSQNLQSFVDTTGTRSTTVGYVLSDDDIGDRFTVDIKQDDRYPSPVFEVRAGASSCPYEPWPDPSGKARVLKRDNPWLEVVPARRDDVQPDQAAVFTLQLNNLSETEEPRLYALRLLTTSNPCGAIVKVGGETITNGLQQYLIASGEMQNALVTVERGPVQSTPLECGTDYEDLAVVLYPPCDGALADTAYFSVTFEDLGPVVFGTPEPADGELSFGEDISITFNEAIDCASVDTSTVKLTYVDWPDSGSAIALDPVCDGKAIILGIDPGVNESDLEGRRLQARVSGVRDPEGNMMSGVATWEFVYRKSLFTWSRLQIAEELDYLEPGTVTAELVNGTAQVVTYAIAEPDSDWFTVSPMSGTLQPGGTQAITLDVRDDLPRGTYDTQLTASADDVTPGVAVLDVYLTVTCSEPVWAVNPSNFEHSMNLVAQLDIGGVTSTDENDRVAAFVGNQLRGVANIDSVGGIPQPHVTFLTIYSNRAEGETVRFQVWDDDECKLYNATGESYPFVANAIHGSPSAPDTLTAIEVAGDSVLAIDVNEGWTWISTNVESADMSVNAVLSDLTPDDGDVIKSQSAFSMYYADSTAWSGALMDLDNVSGYMIRLAGAGTIYHSGEPVASPLSIPLFQGWNWISYLPQEPYPVNHALGGLGGVAVTGDVIKSQDAFAEYVSPNWYGSLEVMEPGVGYKLYLAGADPDSFDYPDAPPLGSALAATGGVGEGDLTGAGVADGAATSDGVPSRSPAGGVPSWSVNYHAYQYNMTVTAVLDIGGRESIDENDVVGAFVGDDCRGVSHPIFVDGVRRYEIFLMVCSNLARGEPVSIRVFDADAGLVYNVAEKLVFQADKVEGSIGEPVALTADSVWGGDVLPAMFALSRNYPNPFGRTTKISYDVPAGGGHVTIRIYDAAGRLVRTLVDGPQTPGRKTAVWDGCNGSGERAASGVYFCHMTAPRFVKTHRMIIVK